MLSDVLARSRIQGRAPLVVFIGLLCVFVATRLWGVAASPFWFDEILSVRIARRPLIEFLLNQHTNPLMEADNNPPLFYALLKVWIGAGGDSRLWLRLFPALTAICSIVPLVLLCRELALRPADVNLAVALMAVNGYLIDYAQEVRAYSLLMGLTLWSLWLYVRLLRGTERSMHVVAALSIINVLLVYTHYFGVLVICAELVFLVLWSRQTLKEFGIVMAVTIVCFAPSAILASREMRGMTLPLARPGVGDVAWFYATLNGPFEIPRSTSVGLLLFAGPILVWGWHLMRKRYGPSGGEGLAFGVLVGASFVPVALTFVASNLLWQSVWLERYLIISAPTYLLLVAAGVNRLHPGWVRTGAVVLVLGWSGIAGLVAITRDDKKIDWERLAKQMSGVTAEHTRRARVYTFERFVAWPLEFHLAAINESRLEVVIVEGTDAIRDPYAWVAFRDTTWKAGVSPEAMLMAKGYQIGSRAVAKSREQVVVFSVWREGIPDASAQRGRGAGPSDGLPIAASSCLVNRGSPE